MTIDATAAMTLWKIDLKLFFRFWWWVPFRKIFSGQISSSVMAAFASIVTSSFNFYVGVHIYCHGIHILELSIVQTHTQCSHVAFIAQLGGHCNCNTKVVGSNPIQSLKKFSGHFSSGAMVHFHPLSCLQLSLNLTSTIERCHSFTLCIYIFIIHQNSFAQAIGLSMSHG